VIDAITDFTSLGNVLEVRQMVLRLIDFFKIREITALFTSMSSRTDIEETRVGLSSAFDTWINLTNVQSNLERNRTLVVVKSRGMAHSNQVREFMLTNKGVELVDIYATPAGAFMGTARLAQMAADEADALTRRQGTEGKRRAVEGKRRALEARIEAMRSEFDSEIKETELIIAQEDKAEKALKKEGNSIAKQRKADGGK
jgi:circadian clock protein KaiC